MGMNALCPILAIARQSRNLLPSSDIHGAADRPYEARGERRGGYRGMRRRITGVLQKGVPRAARTDVPARRDRRRHPLPRVRRPLTEHPKNTVPNTGRELYVPVTRKVSVNPARSST